MTFPSRTQVPEPRQLWWWRTRGLRHESGFPKFSQNKIFRWWLCIWKSSPCLALLYKNQFSKTICRIWTLWWFIDLALHFVRLDLEPWHWVRTVVAKEQNDSRPRGAESGVLGAVYRCILFSAKMAWKIVLQHASNTCTTCSKAKSTKLVKCTTLEACNIKLKWPNQLSTELKHAKTVAKTYWDRSIKGKKIMCTCWLASKAQNTTFKSNESGKSWVWQRYMHWNHLLNDATTCNHLMQKHVRGLKAMD